MELDNEQLKLKVAARLDRLSGKEVRIVKKRAEFPMCHHRWILSLRTTESQTWTAREMEVRQREYVVSKQWQITNVKSVHKLLLNIRVVCRKKRSVFLLLHGRLQSTCILIQKRTLAYIRYTRSL